MEDIRSSLDNIVAECNNSVTHSAPKKLHFEESYESYKMSSRNAKRKRVSDKSLDGTVNTSALSASSPCSPWVLRTMQSDLAVATAKIVQLEEELRQRDLIQRETETLQENKIAALKSQADYSGRKIEQMETHMEILREREQNAKRVKIELQAKLEALERSVKDKINHLQSERLKEAQEARLLQNDLKNELSELRIKCEKLEMESGLANDELEKLRTQLAQQKQRVADYDSLAQKYERDHTDLCVSNNRIKELEQDIANYTDWKEITIKTQARLISIPDMQREIERLTENNKHLNGLIGNNLLLKEQVEDLSARVEKSENAATELITLQVKFKNMEKELKEWISVAQDHCLPNTLVSPIALRSRIEQLLQNEVVLYSESNQALSESKIMKSLKCDLQTKCEMLEKNIAAKEQKLLKYKDFKERMQKKLTLVSRERDFYKQLVENFEKDATYCQYDTSVNDTTTNAEHQLRMRLEMAHRTIEGYKTMIESLRSEIKEVRQQQHNADADADNINQELDTNDAIVENLKTQLSNLELENDKLRRRKEELELELLQHCLKGDYNTQQVKVVHIRDNPADVAYKNSRDIVEKLQAEIERLKRRIHQLQTDNEVTQARLNETTGGLTTNFKETNQLRAELDSAYAKINKTKEVYKAASKEYRSVCYMLFGYRMDRIPQSKPIYKLSSVFAESPDDYLQFRLNDSGSLEMLETPYSTSPSLKILIETQLLQHGSFPAFLSTLTLDLFQRTTVTMT